MICIPDFSPELQTGMFNCQFKNFTEISNMHLKFFTAKIKLLIVPSKSTHLIAFPSSVNNSSIKPILHTKKLGVILESSPLQSLIPNPSANPLGSTSKCNHPASDYFSLLHGISHHYLLPSLFDTALTPLRSILIATRIIIVKSKSCLSSAEDPSMTSYLTQSKR